MPLVTAVVPAYNEADRIGDALGVLKEYVDEVIVIDDASTDETGLRATEGGARVITHKRNRGYIEAVKTGFREASGDVVITYDADGEFPAQVIPALVKPIFDGDADMVQGHRDFIPRPSERLITWIAQRRTHVGDSGTGLRAIRTELARSLVLKGACICGIFALEVASNGGRISEIPISLHKVDKPRKIAWFHVMQLIHVLPWFFKKTQES